MVDMHGKEIDSISVDKEVSIENDESKEDDESYDPQRVTVPLTLCIAIMVGWVSLFSIKL